jgi:hypothetical protein
MGQTVMPTPHHLPSANGGAVVVAAKGPEKGLLPRQRLLQYAMVVLPWSAPSFPMSLRHRRSSLVHR